MSAAALARQISSFNLTPSAKISYFAAFMLLLCVLLVVSDPGLWLFVGAHDDNAAFADMSYAIRAGDLQLVGPKKLGAFPMPSHAWGFPYVVAAVATIARVSDVQAEWVVSFASAIIAAVLVSDLWGFWVAAFLIAADWTFLEYGAYASSEPLFLALVFGSLLAVRRDKPVLAAVLAACSATVRPLGVLLVAVVVARGCYERKVAAAISSAAAAALILGLYCLPLILAFHDPLVSYHGYQSHDWPGGSPVTYPLGAVIANFLNRENLANRAVALVKLGYVVLHVLALGAIGFTAKLRQKAMSDLPAAAFAFIYSIFLMMYNSPSWALSIYPRLLLPVFPFFLFVFEPWLPKRWWIVTLMSCLSVIIASANGGSISTRSYFIHMIDFF